MTTIASRPYPWPYHAAFQPAQTAVLVFTGDSDAVIDAAVAKCVQSLLGAGRRAGVTVVMLPRAGTHEAPPVNVEAGDVVVPRPHLSGFNGAPLDSTLRRRGLRDLLIVGFPFELGADCTMREANDLGYECLLVEDCCTALSPETFAGAVGTLQKSGGIFGASATTEAVMAALRTNS